MTSYNLVIADGVVFTHARTVGLEYVGGLFLFGPRIAKCPLLTQSVAGKFWSPHLCRRVFAQPVAAVRSRCSLFGGQLGRRPVSYPISSNFLIKTSYPLGSNVTSGCELKTSSFSAI